MVHMDVIKLLPRLHFIRFPVHRTWPTRNDPSTSRS